MVFREKVHVFLCGFRKCRMIVRFSLRKMRHFERKSLLLPLIKHNLSFFPPHCGVPIAQILQALPRASAQTIFDMLNMLLPAPGGSSRRNRRVGWALCSTWLRPSFPPKKNIPSLRRAERGASLKKVGVVRRINTCVRCLPIRFA